MCGHQLAEIICIPLIFLHLFKCKYDAVLFCYRGGGRLKNFRTNVQLEQTQASALHWMPANETAMSLQNKDAIYNLYLFLFQLESGSPSRDGETSESDRMERKLEKE